MNALLVSEAKYKHTLPSPFFGLCSWDLAQANQPLGQQKRYFVPTLLGGQPLRRNVVGFVHRYRSCPSNAFDA